MNELQVAKILLKTNSVTLNTVVPYKYASNILSPIYVDCRTISSYPDKRKIIINYFIEYINSFIGKENIDVIVGSGHSGISLATYISEKLKLRMAYVRSVAKSHGKTNVIEGIVKKNDRVLIVSDIFGTEGHIEHSVNVLTEKKTDIVNVLTIFNLNLNIVEKFLKEKDVKFYSLTDLKTLLQVAAVGKNISMIEKDEVLNWLKNPEKWNEIKAKNFKKNIIKAEKDVAEILLKIKAVTLNPNKPYKYSSGILSPIYCDNRLLMSYPNEWSKVINNMLNIIINKIGISNIDVIAGTSTAGISHAAYISEKLNLPMIYVKSESEKHGKKSQIEGTIKANQRVLVIEDLISTGGSSIECVEAVRNVGGIVSDCLAIFTYEMKKATKAFKDVKCNLITLSNFSTLIQVAVDKGYIKKNEQAKAIEWNKDPSGWGKKMGYE